MLDSDYLKAAQCFRQLNETLGGFNCEAGTGQVCLSPRLCCLHTIWLSALITLYDCPLIITEVIAFFFLHERDNTLQDISLVGIPDESV